jgi:hypothetical protein
MEHCISHQPIEYRPHKNKDGSYFDDVIQNYTAITFKNIGVKCPCSEKIYRNKYTFQYEHMLTKEHIDWFKNYNSKDADNSCKTCH